MRRKSVSLGIALVVLCLSSWFTPLQADSKARLDGLWEGIIIYQPAQIEADLTVEIAKSADSSVGTIDFPIQGLKFHPLQNIHIEGSQVSFEFDRSPGSDGPEDRFQFRGELAPDGKKIKGTFSGRLTGQELSLPFQLERTGDAGSERRAEVKRPVTVLSENGEELRTAFNRDKDKTRLVLLLSPTCMSCLSASWVIEKYVLDTIQDEGLRVYTVWGPMLGDEKEEHAREATARMPDPRVAHFWTGAHTVAGQFGKAAGLPERMSGWDTFLLYPPGATWDETLPAPARFMYINKPLPKEQALNAEKLAEWVRGSLQARPRP